MDAALYGYEGYLHIINSSQEVRDGGRYGDINFYWYPYQSQDSELIERGLQEQDNFKWSFNDGESSVYISENGTAYVRKENGVIVEIIFAKYAG